MFDIGFTELMLLALIGLLVLGPEKLPKLARTLGGYTRKAKEAWHNLRIQIESELDDLDKEGEMRRQVTSARQDIEGLKDALGKPLQADSPAGDQPEANTQPGASDTRTPGNDD